MYIIYNSKLALENLNKIKKIVQKEIKELKGTDFYYNRSIDKANKKIEELKVLNTKA